MPIPVPVTQTGLEKSILLAAQKAGKNLKINMGPGAKSIDSLAKPLGRLTGKADEFTKSMEAANARVLAFGASVGVISAVSKSLQELVRTTVQVEKSMADINSILKQTDAQLNNFKNTIFDVARNTGQGFDTVAEAALELSRQGLKAEEVTKRLNDALILSRLSGLSAADSVAGLTAAINSFSQEGLTSAQVLNKISAAAASAAVSDRDLIEGLKRSGSVAVTTGVSFDNLVGIIGSLQEKTARGGAVIGNSLKTIFTRIQDLDKLQSLQKLGVEVTDLSGNVLASDKIIQNLAPTFAKLDQASKVNLADNLVGKFQIAPFLALLEQYNEEIARSGVIANTSLNASEEAYKRNAALNQTLATVVNKATVNLKELGNALGEIGVTDSLKNIISVFNSVVSSITGILDGDGIGSKFAKGLVKGIGSVIAGPGLALALVAIGKLLLDFAKFGAKALQTFFGLNKAAQAQATLQGEIASTLLNDKSVRQAILDIEKLNISQGEKKKLQINYFTTALKEQMGIMQQMQGIAASIAPSVMANTTPKKGKRAAGGFLPIGAERSDIARGVGGAPSSAKPVIIPNFAFGGGQRGTMVANTSEYIVPNYANGGDAIFNQNMVSSMGLPANARKVRAASGFIPNFAGGVGPAGALKAAGITNMTQFKALEGSGKSRVVNGVTISPAQAKSVFDRQKAQKNKKGVLNIPARVFGIAALFSGKKEENTSQNPQTLTHTYAKDLAKAGVQKIIFDGVQIRSLEDTKKGLSERTNRNDLAKYFANPLAQYGRKLIGDTFSNDEAKALSAQIKKIARGDGGVRLFSAAVEGGIFESAINVATKAVGGISEFTSNKDDQIPFDFEESGVATNSFKKAFGFTSKLLKADGKRTASGDAVQSVIKKAFNDDVSRNFISRIAKSQGYPAQKRAAGGYIPNFVDGALGDAIERERSAGLPINQIRINQSGKLRNSQNPMGLAVTNTRDEPTGAIPNFEQQQARYPAGTVIDGKKVGGQFMSDKEAQARKANIDATNKQTEQVKKSSGAFSRNSGMSDGLTNKFFAIQTVGFLLNSALGETTKEADGFAGALAGLTQSALIAGQALFAMQAFGGLSTFGLGKASTSSLKSMATSSRAIKNAKKAGGIGGTLKAIGPRIALAGKLLLRMTGPLGIAIGLFTAANAIYKRWNGTTRNLETAQKSLKSATEAAAKELSEFKFDSPERKQQFESNAETLADLIDGKLKNVNVLFEGERDQQTKDIRDLTLQAALSGATNKEVISLVDDLIAGGRDSGKLKDGRTIKTLGNDQVLKVIKALEDMSKRDRSGDQDKFLKFLNTTFSPINGESMQSMLSRDDEVGAAALKIARQKADELNLTDELRESSISLVKAKGQEQNKNIDMIDLQSAKTRIAAAVEIKKLMLDQMSITEKQLAQGQAFGSLDSISIQRLQNKIEKEKLLDNLAKDNLDIILKESDNLEKLNIDKDKILKIEQAIAKISPEDLKNKQKVKGIIGQILGVNIEDEKVLNSILGSLNAGLDKRKGIYDQQLKNLDITQKETAELVRQKQIIAEIDADMRLRSQRTAFSQSGPLRGKIAASQDRINELEKSKQKFEYNPLELQDIQEEIRLENINLNRYRGQQSKIDIERRMREIEMPDSVKNVIGSYDQLAKSQNPQQFLKEAVEAVQMNIDEGTFVPIPEEFTKFKISVEALDEEMKKNSEATEDAEQALRKLDLTLSEKGGLLIDRSKVLKEFSRSEAGDVRRRGEALKAVDKGGEFAGQDPELVARRMKMQMSILDRIEEGLPTALEQSNQFSQSIASAALSFKDNLASGISEALSGAQSLGDALRGAAKSFLDTINKAFMQRAVDNLMTGVFNFASGGPIRGGSGTKDDVPAMLMGGEYVMNKKAVKKYGMGFMEALNSGSIQGFASGGQVRDRQGMFTTPGVNGAGPIKGMKDLMSFALQTPVSLIRDTVNEVGGFLGSESGRLSMFGRRNNPEFQRTQEAKQQAFQLAIQEMNANQQAKEAKEASKKGFMRSLIGAAASGLISTGIKGFSGGYSMAKKAGLTGFDAITEGFKGAKSAYGDIFTGIGKTFGFGSNVSVEGAAKAQLTGPQLIKRGLSGGKITQISNEYAKLEASQAVIEKTLDAIDSNTVSASSILDSASDSFVGIAAAGDFGDLPTLKSNLIKMHEAQTKLMDELIFKSGVNVKDLIGSGVLPPEGYMPKQATGGLIPSAGGVDTVPALLSGGEFVMNAAATRNIGTGNLQALNSGSGIGDNSELVSKLDELIRTTETSQSTGDINITINSSTGMENQSNPQDVSEQQKNLSQKIKSAVKQVIADEQRLGGQLRR